MADPGAISVSAQPTQSRGGSIAVSATLSKPRKRTAKMRASRHPLAQMHPVKDDVEARTWKLYNSYRGTRTEADLKNEAYKDFDAKPLDDIWKGVKEHLGEGAHNIWIGLDDLIVRYRDSANQIQYLDLSKQDPKKPIDPKLLELIQKVRIAAKKVWLDMKLGHNFDDPTVKTFAIPNKQWRDAMPKTPSQFLEAGHFDQLDRVVKGDRTALNQIMAAEAFIQQLKASAKAQKERLETQIKDPAFHNRPVAEQKAIKKSFAQVEKFEKDLEEVDRFAIYWAVGVWGDTDPTKVTQAERFEKAKLIAEGVESTLSRKLKPGEDPRWRITQLLQFRKPEAESLLGLGPFIKAYAADAGDLAISSKLDLIRHVGEDGDREITGPSLIDFIASNVMNLADPNFKPDEALGALKLGFDADLTQAIVQGITGAKTEAERIRAEAARVPGTWHQAAAVFKEQFHDLMGK